MGFLKKAPRCRSGGGLTKTKLKLNYISVVTFENVGAKIRNFLIEYAEIKKARTGGSGLKPHKTKAILKLEKTFYAVSFFSY